MNVSSGVRSSGSTWIKGLLIGLLLLFLQLAIDSSDVEDYLNS